MSDRPPSASRRRVLAASGTLLLGGCLGANAPGESADPTPGGEREHDYDLSVSHDGAEPDPDWSPPTDSPLDHDYGVEVLVEGLDVPWDLAFAPNDELFITERTGTIRRFSSGDVVDVLEPADAIDAGSIEPGEEGSWWVEGGEGGLLGAAVHPSYPDPPLVYAYYTYEARGGPRNKVVYFDVTADDPNETATTVVDDIPGENIHNGGRIAFGPEDYLWIGTGDAGEDGLAQDPDSLAGKVLRVTPAGEPAPDNPGEGDPRVYSLGHRNVQTITWLPDGSPVAAEHGPSGGDEVSLIGPGWNGGWPEARDRTEYEASDHDRPVVNTGTETWAPSGGVFYTGDAVPGLRNRLLVGGLRSQRVNVVTLSRPEDDPPPAEGGRRFDGGWLDDRLVATAHPLFPDELGRIRHVEQGPNGELYAVTSNRDGRATEEFPAEGDDVLVRITQE